MKYFTPDFVEFFMDLAKNNHKDWFHENKKRYELSVKKPFTLFLTDLITEIQKFDPTLAIESKDCILRINKDIRFSKDKTPYNLYYTAFISAGGKNDKSIPGLFLRFSPEEIGIMAGCYGVSATQLLGIRNTIQADIAIFKKLYTDKKLIDKFGSIQGEELKRIPKEFQATYEKEPLIAKKQFYVVAMREPELLTSDHLINEIMLYWHTARPFNDYLTKAIKS
ncbi:DUF2461 domain-containing protein [Confluentibacter sediminis]|uniref:DUF2461 domain-containing protein n=1 Tax=Confluentibacter sediminis TaxID=2219045 RepID=UPI000DAEDFC6|nr:DUF2461 domain-containing protein [Confluentibacter sediminis]